MAQAVQTLKAELQEQGVEFDVVTPKDVGKILDCATCGKKVIANAFAAAAKTYCKGCGGGSTTPEGALSVVRGEPADLTNKLINPHFAHAVCPVHPDDESHVMELIHVTHSLNYGPNRFVGYKGSVPVYQQLATGESVTHQCQVCKATVGYSTTPQQLFRPQNDIKIDDGTRLPGIVLRRLQGVKEETIPA